MVAQWSPNGRPSIFDQRVLQKVEVAHFRQDMHSNRRCKTILTICISHTQLLLFIEKHVWSFHLSLNCRPPVAHLSRTCRASFFDQRVLRKVEVVHFRQDMHSNRRCKTILTMCISHTQLPLFIEKHVWSFHLSRPVADLSRIIF